jgi:hypothetical protein
LAAFAQKNVVKFYLDSGKGGGLSIGSAIDAPFQVLLVLFLRGAVAQAEFAVQPQADRFHEGAFARPVLAAQEDDGLLKTAVAFGL